MNDRTETQPADTQTETAGVRAIDRAIQQLQGDRASLNRQADALDAERVRLLEVIAEHDQELRALRRARARLIRAELEAVENAEDHDPVPLISPAAPNLGDTSRCARCGSAIQYTAFVGAPAHWMHV